jgi:hypothetical protein
MKRVKVGPVPGYKHTYLVKKVEEKRPLKWHTAYGSLYIYDDSGNSVTVERGKYGQVWICEMRNDGEELLLEECDYDWFSHPLCPFQFSDLEPFIENYRDYVGDIY